MSRLDSLVCVLAPVLLADIRYRPSMRTTETASPKEEPWDDAELRRAALAVVDFAVALDRAIADEELRQMTPPKG